MELRVVKDAHGSKHDAYPFLNDSNEFDKALTRNLLVYRPFLQKKGEQTTAWTNVVEMCLESTSDDGKPVFGKSLTVKSAKKRFAEYLSFMEEYRKKKPLFNSGGDNEPYPDILRALEDLFDLHESFKNTSEEKRAAVADAKARDRAEGDAIREASLGLFVASREEKENDNQADDAAGGSGKKNGRRQSFGGRNSGGENNHQMVEAIFQKYAEEKKEEKRRRMDFNERRIALEEKRAEDERASRAMQHEMMMTLISHLSNK
jgi:hypothetical protein